MKCELFTIGIYGTTESSFFDALVANRITDFVDVRHRRGLRGHEYSYGNASALQKRLAELGIRYAHHIELSPADDIRELQMKADAAEHIGGRHRTTLDLAFATRYKAEVLSHFDPAQFLKEFPEDARIALFCVEGHAGACHRSLLADRIAADTGVTWRDITPL